MEKKQIIKEILEAIRSHESAIGDYRGKRRRPCETYSEDIYDLYVDSLLPEDKASAFESHLKTCLYCCQRLEAALKRKEQTIVSHQPDKTALSQSLRDKLQHLNALFETRETAIANLYAVKRKSDIPGRVFPDAREHAGKVKRVGCLEDKIEKQRKKHLSARDILIEKNRADVDIPGKD